MVQEDALVDWRSSHKSHKQIQTIKNDMYTCYIQWYVNICLVNGTQKVQVDWWCCHRSYKQKACSSVKWKGQSIKIYIIYIYIYIYNIIYIW